MLKGLFESLSLPSSNNVYLREAQIEIDSKGIWLKDRNNGVSFDRVKKIKKKGSTLLEAFLLLGSLYMVYSMPSSIAGYLFFLLLVYIAYITRHSAVVYLKDGNRITLLFSSKASADRLFSIFEDYQERRGETVQHQSNPDTHQGHTDDQKKTPLHG